MRIGIYDPYLDDLGGGEKYMLTIAECLAKKYRVEVFWDNKRDLDRVLERFTLDLSQVALVKNIFSPSFGFLKRIFETRKYDAIIFLSDGSIPLTFAGKLFLHLQQPIPNLKTSLWSKLKLLRVSKVFCNSSYSKSYVDRDLGVESLVIYPKVEMRPQKVKKENIILHVGRFRPRDPVTGATDYKKQGVMIEVFRKMVKKGLQDWRFILAVSIRDGEENVFNKLRQETKEFPMEFLINKSNEELWDLYNQAKIYWHASGYGEDLLKHPEYAEHFGISTVEAMGAGAVPVVIAAGGQKEIVQDGVDGLLWETLEELESKTLKLIRNENLWEKMSTAAKKRAQFFSGNRFCQEITTLIES